MKRSSWIALTVTVILAWSSAVVFASAVSAVRVTPATPTATSEHASSTEERLDAIIGTMSLEEKVGQLFMIHGYGTSLYGPSEADVDGNQELHGLDTLAQVIETYHPAGIAYFNFTNNIEDLEQVALLSNEIQELAMATGAGIPMLIGIDQEHGVVRRIADPMTEFPGSMALGATDDPQDAYNAAHVTALELRAVGVNVNFAPVADVNSNPYNPIIGTRSFGDDPEQVSDLVAAQVRGFRDGGIVATLKHFPGHGDTDVDSHTGLPLIDRPRDIFESVDLPPFQAGIDAGAEMVMTAHIVVPAFDDSGRPATLSETILTDLLRESMGFDGVIVTDALTMDGVQEGMEPERIPVEALKAGADLLLMPANLELAYQAVLAAVQSGELSEARIDASVRRILRLKAELGLFEAALVDVASVEDVIGMPAQKALAQDIARRSVTLVRQEGPSIPWLSPLTGEVGNFGEGTPSVLITGWGETTVYLLADVFESRGMRSEAVVSGQNPSEDEIHRVAEMAPDFDLVVVVTMNAHAEDRSGQRDLVAELIERGNSVVVLSVGVPYDTGMLPAGGTYLATYGYRRVSLEAAVDVLLGEVEPAGRLPVALTSSVLIY